MKPKLKFKLGKRKIFLWIVSAPFWGVTECLSRRVILKFSNLNPLIGKCQNLKLFLVLSFLKSTLEGRKSLRAILWTSGFGLYHVANKLLQKVNHRIKGNFFVWYTAKINFEWGNFNQWSARAKFFWSNYWGNSF